MCVVVSSSHPKASGGSHRVVLHLGGVILTLGASEAFDVALHNRLDFMNGRAALVDSWRLIQVRADALQSVLDVTAAGDVRTSGNNPTGFRAPTSNLRLGLEFDAPVTRLLERNAYRESLITYQRSRRSFIQSRDSLHQGVRALLRDISILHRSLNIRRRAFWVAIGQVAQTQADLNNPQAQLGPTTTFNLLGAASALRESQNSFLRTWLSYQAARLRLARELGVMELNPDGTLNRESLPGAAQQMVPSPVEEQSQVKSKLPPMVPGNLVFQLTSEADGVSLAPSASGPANSISPAADDDHSIRAELGIIRALGRSDDPGRLFHPTSQISLPEMQPTRLQKQRELTDGQSSPLPANAPVIQTKAVKRRVLDGQMSPLPAQRPPVVDGAMSQLP